MKKVIGIVLTLVMVAGIGFGTFKVGTSWLAQHDAAIANMAVEEYQNSEQFEVDAVSYVEENYYGITVAKDNPVTNWVKKTKTPNTIGIR